VSEPINCSPSELSTFLQALAEESSRTCCSDTDPSARSKSGPTARPSSSNGSQTGASLGSPSLMTSVTLTGDLGADSSMSSTAHSRASPSPVQATDDEWRPTYGLSNIASSERLRHGMSWPRTSRENPSNEPPGTFATRVIELPFVTYRLPTWVPLITDDVGGSLLPTPTETANFDSPSMRRQWRAHRRLQLWTGGRTTPTHIEFLMGWPLGWSDSAPSGMASFLAWKERHGNYCDPWLTTELTMKTGERFGRLTVVELLPGKVHPKKVAAKARCLCDCGNTWIGARGHLTSGHTKSCGCRHVEVSREQGHKIGSANLRHGHCPRGRPSSPEYMSWLAMTQRCTDPNNVDWPGYGGRGISICPQWRTPRKGGTGGFEQFLADLGPRPADTELDRIDGTGNYEPSNCQWLNASENHRKQQRRGHRTLAVAASRRLSPEEELFEFMMGRTPESRGE
jgi:hypothetical protein